MANTNRLSEEKWLVGASTDATKSLLSQYCEMIYKPGDTVETLRPLMQRCFSISAPRHNLDQVIHHSQFRLAIMVGKVHQPIEFEKYPDFVLKAWLFLVALVNLACPWFLSLFLTRVCFYTGGEAPEFLVHGHDGKDGKARTQFVPLTRNNMHQELCLHIDGIGAGLFLDGGICDLSLNTHLQHPDRPGLLLYDQLDNIKQTALDCFVPWRKAPSHFFDHCSVLQPSEKFVSSLPERKLPTVGDWFDQKFIDEPQKRQGNWMKAYHLSQEAFCANLWGLKN
ncbi:hypothetical protein HDU98_007744 [Podochytrium sp. JEL0797]|nr:hypothetical protein HDU98_007744 [Podochytrium sp. JEL0797]